MPGPNGKRPSIDAGMSRLRSECRQFVYICCHLLRPIVKRYILGWFKAKGNGKHIHDTHPFQLIKLS